MPTVAGSRVHWLSVVTIGFMAAFVLAVGALVAADVAYMLGADPKVMREVFESRELRYAVYLSLVTTVATLVLVVLFAVPVGYALSRYRFPGSVLLDAIVDLPIVLPPVVIGVSLLVVFHTRGGQWIQGLEWPAAVHAHWWLRWMAWLLGERPLEFVYTPKGIVLAQFRTRAYWENPTPTAGTPPSCSAVFSMGELAWKCAGSPGGPCDECPFNEFGSSGRGKACGESRLMILATDNSALPVMLRAPAASLKASKRYMAGLAPLRYDQVVTQFSLDKKANADGIAYCSLVMEKVGVLTPDNTEGVRNAARAFKSTIDGLATLPSVVVQTIEEDEL